MNYLIDTAITIPFLLGIAALVFTHHDGRPEASRTATAAPRPALRIVGKRPYDWEVDR